MSNAEIRLAVLPPRKGYVRVAWDSEGMWFVRCDYLHDGQWRDHVLMTTDEVKRLTGVMLEEPKNGGL